MMLSIVLVCPADPSLDLLDKIGAIPALITSRAPQSLTDYEVLLIAQGRASEDLRATVEGLDNAKCVCLLGADADASLLEAMQRATGDYAFFADAAGARLERMVKALGELEGNDVLHIGAPSELHFPFAPLVLSRAALRSVLGSRDSVQAYRTLRTGSGLKHKVIETGGCGPLSRSGLIQALRVRWRGIFSSKVMPLRVVSFLALFGAGANVAYSFYVMIIFMVKQDVIPGWATLSMQQSGMFLIFSLALFVGSEYVIHAIQRDRRCVVIEEVRSARKLFDQCNVERV